MPEKEMINKKKIYHLLKGIIIMGITVSPVANQQQFATWLTRTNQIISLLGSNLVTMDSSSAGSLSSGNVQVNGNFYTANLMIGLGVYGGAAGALANL